MNWEFCTTATGECFTRKEYFYFGDHLNLCKIPNGCFILGLIYKKQTFLGFGFSASGTEGDKAFRAERVQHRI